MAQFGVSQALCCRLGAVCRPCFWPSGARRPCRQSWRVAAALITLGATGLGMAQGGRVEGSMLPGTQRLPVSSLPVSGRPSACAAASGQVMSFRASFGPHLSPASAPHFLSTSSDPLDPRINHPAIRPLPLVPGRPLGDPGDPHRVDTALVEEQRGFPTGPAGFRPCLCPHRTLFLCCRCAKRKLVGASKARCSDRRPLPNRCRELRRRIPACLLEEA